MLPRLETFTSWALTIPPLGSIFLGMEHTTTRSNEMPAKTKTVYHVATPGCPPVPRTLYLCPDGSYRRIKELRKFR